MTLFDILRKGTGNTLDLVSLEELRKRTGTQEDQVLPWIVQELLCNSLDSDASHISVNVGEEDNFDVITVTDNGSTEITYTNLESILDYRYKTSSKRGLHTVSRGSLGNALKCAFGYGYALAKKEGLEPPDIIVRSRDKLYTVNLRVDPIKQEILNEITTTRIEYDMVNSFSVKIPRKRTVLSILDEEQELEPTLLTGKVQELITAAAIVNPGRTIEYRIWNHPKATLGSMGERVGMRREHSVLWYSSSEFVELFYDYTRTDQEIKLIEFISIFRGFKGKTKQKEILHQLSNHDIQKEGDVQFLPGSTLNMLKEEDVARLYTIMYSMGKPIGRRSVEGVLGSVGEEALRQTAADMDWTTLGYHCVKSRYRGRYPNSMEPSYPFLVEVTAFDRGPDDGEGLKVLQCVNFMATSYHLFHRFDFQHYLGKAGLKPKSPVTVLVHVVSPVVQWMDYGKTRIGGTHFGNAIEKCLKRAIPVSGSPYSKKTRKTTSWVPSGKLGSASFESRLATFATEILLINEGRKGSIIEKLGTRSWCYVIENLHKITKDMFDKTEKAINDCRKIGLLPMDIIAPDQDESRRFSGIHEATSPSSVLIKLVDDVEMTLDMLPHLVTDYWVDEEYYLMMSVEKGDVKRLFEPICRQYHVPLVNSKGWPPLHNRADIATLARKAEDRGLKPVLLLFYDHDPAGLKISSGFRKLLEDMKRGTGWDPANLIIERFGLNQEEIDRYGLPWIENLKTSSGRESTDRGYVAKYGRRKCELNALFRDEKTLQIGAKICKDAIEKYYGGDVLVRFRAKEETTRKSLRIILDDPLWKYFKNEIEKMCAHLETEDPVSRDKNEPEGDY